ncbi:MULTISPECIES: hypothetical protein [unclassified Leifsonia]|uniref:hypothetical protein n=1 Tax=unclassified Leifsonia TaxID=2663824 RepID=UPI000A18F1E3|nr:MULTISPECIES: hypothetical protein [unclassified Leifsonia]QIZ97243.1 hypothetical protein HF024_00910 [Leifsonia sp. PS1209]
MRFTTPVQKTVVVVVLLAINAVLALALNALRWEPGSIAVSILQLIGWYLVSRVFRGPGEPVAAARPWWRMTARPLLSGVLGAGYLLVALVNLVLSVVGFGSASGTVSVLVELVLAALFLTTFVRLRALGTAPRTP